MPVLDLVGFPQHLRDELTTKHLVLRDQRSSMAVHLHPRTQGCSTRRRASELSVLDLARADLTPCPKGTAADLDARQLLAALHHLENFPHALFEDPGLVDLLGILVAKDPGWAALDDTVHDVLRICLAPTRTWLSERSESTLDLHALLAVSSLPAGTLERVRSASDLESHKTSLTLPLGVRDLEPGGVLRGRVGDDLAEFLLRQRAELDRDGFVLARAWGLAGPPMTLALSLALAALGPWASVPAHWLVLLSREAAYGSTAFALDDSASVRDTAVQLTCDGALPETALTLARALE